MPPLYTLRNLRRMYGTREALHIPDLELEAHTVYGLLGPNGAGKTTLIRLLSFMDAPNSGEILFQGEHTAARAEFRSRTVWVPQSPVMFTGSLLYNVEYPLRIRGVSAKERRGAATALLESLGLAHLAARPAHRLSGGETQRGSIARALAAGPEVILFDEPTANVDFRSRDEIINLIRSLCRERKISVILATHDALLADELCPEQITLFDGKILSRRSVSPDTAMPPHGAPA